MRDPMSWALPVFRAFGIPVKVHIFFFVITLGLFVRQVAPKDSVLSWDSVLFFTVFLLFGIILLHELGHCYGGFRSGGEASEILIWPLGGLAYVDVPHNWKAHTVTAAAGPAVNVVLCLVCGLVLFANGLLPGVNPIYDPYVSEMKNYRDGRVYTSEYGWNLYRPGSQDRVNLPDEMQAKLSKPDESSAALVNATLERAVADTWLVWVNRTFWLSWVLLLINLLPAFPLDGGQIMQGLIWARSDYRRGTTIACYSGYVVGVLLLIVAIAANEALLLGLGLFMFYASSVKLHALEVEEGVYGDFSQGYMSLDRDEPAPRPRRPNVLKRWLQARAARRLQREIEQRQAEDERMDSLLDKIARFGKDTLTDEERRFMERVSARYRNR
ncbi:MAG TPA: site-2 protease family protein [Fimbriiglobus sp.]|jgi:Zn-dependent protease|nr:site-2 protease family protein [Fimbriiglobus sp.]